MSMSADSSLLHATLPLNGASSDADRSSLLLLAVTSSVIPVNERFSPSHTPLPGDSTQLASLAASQVAMSGSSSRPDVIDVSPVVADATSGAKLELTVSSSTVACAVSSNPTGDALPASSNTALSQRRDMDNVVDLRQQSIVNTSAETVVLPTSQCIGLHCTADVFHSTAKTVASSTVLTPASSTNSSETGNATTSVVSAHASWSTSVSDLSHAEAFTHSSTASVLKSPSCAILVPPVRSPTTPIRKSTRPRKYPLRCAEFVSLNRSPRSPLKRSENNNNSVKAGKKCSVLKKSVESSQLLSGQLLSGKRGRPKGSKNKKTLYALDRRAAHIKRSILKKLQAETLGLASTNMVSSVQPEAKRSLNSNDPRCVNLESQHSSQENEFVPRKRGRPRKRPFIKNQFASILSDISRKSNMPNQRNESKGVLMKRNTQDSLAPLQFADKATVSVNSGKQLSRQLVPSRRRPTKLNDNRKTADKTCFSFKTSQLFPAVTSPPAYPSRLAAGSNVLGSIGLVSELFSIHSVESRSMLSFGDLCMNNTSKEVSSNSAVGFNSVLPAHPSMTLFSSSEASVAVVTTVPDVGRTTTTATAVESYDTQQLDDFLSIERILKKKRKKKKSKHNASSDSSGGILDTGTLEALVGSMVGLRLVMADGESCVQQPRTTQDNVLASIFSRSHCNRLYALCSRRYARLPAARAAAAAGSMSVGARYFKAKKRNDQMTVSKGSCVASLTGNVQIRLPHKKRLKAQLEADVVKFASPAASDAELSSAAQKSARRKRGRPPSVNRVKFPTADASSATEASSKKFSRATSSITPQSQSRSKNLLHTVSRNNQSVNRCSAQRLTRSDSRSISSVSSSVVSVSVNADAANIDRAPNVSSVSSSAQSSGVLCSSVPTLHPSRRRCAMSTVSCISPSPAVTSATCLPLDSSSSCTASFVFHSRPSSVLSNGVCTSNQAHTYLTWSTRTALAAPVLAGKSSLSHSSAIKTCNLPGLSVGKMPVNSSILTSLYDISHCSLGRASSSLQAPSGVTRCSMTLPHCAAFGPVSSLEPADGHCSREKLTKYVDRSVDVSQTSLLFEKATQRQRHHVDAENQLVSHVPLAVSKPLSRAAGNIHILGFKSSMRRSSSSPCLLMSDCRYYSGTGTSRSKLDGSNDTAEDTFDKRAFNSGYQHGKMTVAPSTEKAVQVDMFMGSRSRSYATADVGIQVDNVPETTCGQSTGCCVYCWQPLATSVVTASPHTNPRPLVASPSVECSQSDHSLTSLLGRSLFNNSLPVSANVNNSSDLLSESDASDAPRTASVSAAMCSVERAAASANTTIFLPVSSVSSSSSSMSTTRRSMRSREWGPVTAPLASLRDTSEIGRNYIESEIVSDKCNVTDPSAKNFVVGSNVATSGHSHSSADNFRIDRLIELPTRDPTSIAHSIDSFLNVTRESVVSRKFRVVSGTECSKYKEQMENRSSGMSAEQMCVTDSDHDVIVIDGDTESPKKYSCKGRPSSTTGRGHRRKLDRKKPLWMRHVTSASNRLTSDKWDGNLDDNSHSSIINCHDDGFAVTLLLNDASELCLDGTPRRDVVSSWAAVNSECDPLPVSMPRNKRRHPDDDTYSQSHKRPSSRLSASSFESALNVDELDSDSDMSSNTTRSSSPPYSGGAHFVSVASPEMKRLRDSIPPLPRKKYQTAGLFSNTYKEAVYTKMDRKVHTTYNPLDHEHGLFPQPLHIGKYLRDKCVDFQLPYDTWLLHDTGLLHLQKPASPNYRRIRSNIYVDAKPICRDYEPHPCNCQLSEGDVEQGCGELCLNRVVYTECNVTTCPCGERCSNQRIQRRNWLENSIQKFITDDRGYGVRATCPITAGSFIIEYCGEVVSEQEFRRRMSDEYAHERHHYCLDLDSGMVIDGYRMSNLCRFVNHSCQPNCEMQKWNVNGVYRMALFALADIPPGCELTYDYNFHAYNLHSQQICKCSSTNCRGVMGGRSQRMVTNGSSGSVGVTAVSAACSNSGRNTARDRKKSLATLGGIRENTPAIQQLPTPTKPLSRRERKFARKHRLFLLRNIRRVHELRQAHTAATSSSQSRTTDEVLDNRQQLLSQALAEIFHAVTSAHDKSHSLIVPLMRKQSSEKEPDCLNVADSSISLNMIEKKITSNKYQTFDALDDDFCTLFNNAELHWSGKSELGQIASVLKTVYANAKQAVLDRLPDLIGSNPISCQTGGEESKETAVTNDDDAVEVIRCICNLYCDEGLMIQCEKCEVWQHCDCVGVHGDVEHYLCEQCDPRPVIKDIPLVPQPPDAVADCQYYLTLMTPQGIQVKVGDCVYVTREGAEPLSDECRACPSNAADRLDIFRVEQLCMKLNGDRLALGHYYLKPHETFHEPTRRFFECEVFRSPQYHVIPLDAVVGICWVVDLNTFCKGRPKGAREGDVYICEFRVDKTARLFYKINRPRYPVSTKPYCFDHFDKKLQLRRTFTPHAIPDGYIRRGADGRQSDTRVTTIETADMNTVVRTSRHELKLQKKKDRLEKVIHMLSQSTSAGAR